ncbi:hypothetical protein [Streptomyces rhizosphaerihabitans]|uniref:hypothetical protein n=1 Tax=Streptomyces rhizosphaerihabitans TaxID=1266770 RepID=UPI0021C05AC1|nr:hypothetical protein [Streptomyces rhizosphaerihabitans]MCT9008485.1 hypothetical protein [Streptomyces rhizosphaerihabitans]
MYSRLFLNCYQRQSLVMLAEREPQVHQLFHRCLISTDDILQQIIREQRPKYSFESGFFDRDDLERIGIVREEVEFETYADARSLLLDVVSQEGYAILVGDVFYWPHCPEYTTKHLVHTILLKGYDPKTAEWSLLDDNPASLLCAYTYPEELIAAGFDNGELRRVRYFTTKPFDAQEAGVETRHAFSRLLERYQDSYTLLSDVGELISCPWIAPERAVAALHDAFSVYQGTRAGLGEYIRRTCVAPDVEAVVDRIVRQAEGVMNQLLLGKVTGSVDPGRLTDACRGLKADEQELLVRLKAVDEARESK